MTSKPRTTGNRFVRIRVEPDSEQIVSTCKFCGFKIASELAKLDEKESQHAKTCLKK